MVNEVTIDVEDACGGSSVVRLADGEEWEWPDVLDGMGGSPIVVDGEEYEFHALVYGEHYRWSRRATTVFRRRSDGMFFAASWKAPLTENEVPDYEGSNVLVRVVPREVVSIVWDVLEDR